jgi:hypothetical protein
MEEVKANCGRKRMRERDFIGTEKGLEELGINWARVSALGNDVAILFCLLVLTVLRIWIHGTLTLVRKLAQDEGKDAQVWEWSPPHVSHKGKHRNNWRKEIGSERYWKERRVNTRERRRQHAAPSKRERRCREFCKEGHRFQRQCERQFQVETV